MKEQVVIPNWERVSVIFWMLLVLVLTTLVACSPRMCRKADIVITSHPTKPRPAGRVTVDCDGRVVSELLAEEVKP